MALKVTIVYDNLTESILELRYHFQMMIQQNGKLNLKVLELTLVFELFLGCVIFDRFF